MDFFNAARAAAVDLMGVFPYITQGNLDFVDVVVLASIFLFGVWANWKRVF